MPGVSKYERELIDALLQSTPPPPIDPGSGLAIFDTSDAARRTYDIAIAPALRAADLNTTDVALAFNDFSKLATVAHAIQSAQAIVVDLTSLRPEIFYCLGLAHALGRCPILITASNDESLPFDLRSLRCIRYYQTPSHLLKLREALTRRAARLPRRCRTIGMMRCRLNANSPNRVSIDIVVADGFHRNLAGEAQSLLDQIKG